MVVYVDDFRVPATIGVVRGRWSHLTADTPEELHDFAAQLDLLRERFQGRCRYHMCPAVNGLCAHFHYDVVDRERDAAIALGAEAIDMRQMHALVSARSPRFRRP